MITPDGLRAHTIGNRHLVLSEFGMLFFIVEQSNDIGRHFVQPSAALNRRGVNHAWPGLAFSFLAPNCDARI